MRVILHLMLDMLLWLALLCCYGWCIALLWVYSMLLCMACCAMMGVGNQIQDQMMMAEWQVITGWHAWGTDDVAHWGMRFTGKHMEVQQKWSTEVLRSIASDMSLCPGGGCTLLPRNWRMDGPLASTMLSKPVAPWLSNEAWISDRREWRERRERE